MLELTRLLPVPGPVWSDFPQRPAGDAAPPRRRARWRSALRQAHHVAQGAAVQVRAWHALDETARAPALQALRMRLRREGLDADALAQALGCAADSATRTLQLTPRPTQLLAAAVLLDNRMAEMATGEGKTLAIGLAAAVAALAGVPVHVVTANDYLARRDAAQLGPLFAALGLRAAALDGGATEDAKRTVYAHDIVYATAKDLAFDFLRDRQAGACGNALVRQAAAFGGRAARPPVMRGLSMALLDEADSILLDEAETPLILALSAPQAAWRAFLWQALALARQLGQERDFLVHHADRLVTLSAAGEQRVTELAAGLGGPWRRARYRRETVAMALAALHAHHRNEHYVVRDGAIELLDEVTGRVASGRVWSRGLHTLVALKEGLSPPPETETVAQTTFQRFFQRYWRLCGISGTLCEARSELSGVYGSSVVRIPLHQPCRRRSLPPRRFGDAAQRFEAAAAQVARLHAAGRPVLLGTDSVAASQQLSECLRRHGIEHRVLNALHDADEAAIVALAGQSGRVTVATRMAGRGTDIELDAAARAAGGLHVLSCQDNPSRRLDRQLAGRAGRHGDPGSAEEWLLVRFSTPAPQPVADKVTVWNPDITFALGNWLALARRQWMQWREEHRRAAVRRRLLEQDRHWERRLAFAGPPR